MSTYLDKYYIDKKYINTNEYIKNNFLNYFIKDISNIIMDYLNNTIPICILCNGQANKNFIIKYTDIEYKIGGKIKVNIDICITCLSIKIPYIFDNKIKYDNINNKKYYEIFTELYGEHHVKYLCLFKYLVNNIDYGIIYLGGMDMLHYCLCIVPNLNHYLNNNFKLFDDKDYPTYKYPAYKYLI